MKRFFAIALAGVMSLSLAACSPSGGDSTPSAEPTTEVTEPADDQNPDETQPTEDNAQTPDDTPTDGESAKMGMITDVGGVNDQSFNQSAWEGMEKANAELGVEVSYNESKTDADYEPFIESAIDNGNQLVLGIGYKMADAIQAAGENYPDTQFAIIDSAYSEEQVPNNNITGVVFKQNEASYLVGVIAAKMTETNKIGFVCGSDSTTMNEFGYGFYAGILSELPDAEIYGQYSNSFSDPAMGKSIANQMYTDGCDIVYACAGDTGNGVIEAAKEKGKWVIGVDRDQNSLAPDNVLTSAMKRVDVAVYDLAKKLQEGTLQGGQTIVYGLDSGGVDIAPTSDKHVPADILAYIDEVKEKIISGEIVVPNTAEDFAAAFPDAAFMQ